VGYSRVYLGVHYPFDVLGGWALGAVLGWAALRLARRLDPLRFRGPPRGVDVGENSL
jgi:undecaprenyl-diphosphatase